MQSLIDIPAALVTQSAGDSVKAMLSLGNVVVAVMSWVDLVPRTSAVVSWEFWTNSNDECGLKCDKQKAFIADFAADATYLVQNKYTAFTPHYITLSCGAGTDPASPFCAKQCTNNGRYCQFDPDGNLDNGYSGRDIVLENLRSICVFRVANSTARPELWWRYMTLVGAGCSMKSDRYSSACAIGVVQQLLLSPSAVQDCMGDTSSDAVNPALQAEHDALSSDGRRGDVAFFPTIIANGVQYRGDMENTSVLEFLCSGFSLADAPPRCLGDNVIRQPCTGGRYGQLSCAARRDGDGATRCQESGEYPYFRCTCESGSTLVADAYGSQRCTATNSCSLRAVSVPLCGCPTCVCQTMPGGATPRCSNVTVSECDLPEAGGCWHRQVDGTKLSACVPDLAAKKAAGLAGIEPSSVRGYVCRCPPGYAGDPVTDCHDIDECRDTVGVCSGPNMVCLNRAGGYRCGCVAGYALDVNTDMCLAMTSGKKGGVSGAGVFFIVVFTLGTAGGAMYALYQWRLKKHMNDEVRNIMSQYLPMGNADDDFRPLRGEAPGQGREMAMESQQEETLERR